MTDKNTTTTTKSGLTGLNEAFQRLTYREMKDVAEALSASIDGVNGLKVKPEVIAEALDALGEYLLIEVEQAE